MTLYYKNKNGDHVWHKLPDTEEITELTGENVADLRDLPLGLELWELPFGLALAYYFVNLAHIQKVPSRLLRLAIYHKSRRVRKKNKTRIRKIWKRQFGGTKQK